MAARLTGFEALDRSTLTTTTLSAVVGKLPPRHGQPRFLRTKRGALPVRLIRSRHRPYYWLAFWESLPPHWYPAKVSKPRPSLEGFGRLQTDALADLAESTCECWVDYVETDEPLTADAQRLRDWLRQHFEPVPLKPSRGRDHR